MHMLLQSWWQLGGYFGYCDANCGNSLPRRLEYQSSLEGSILFVIGPIKSPQAPNVPYCSPLQVPCQARVEIWTSRSPLYGFWLRFSAACFYTGVPMPELIPIRTWLVKWQSKVRTGTPSWYYTSMPMHSLTGLTQFEKFNLISLSPNTQIIPYSSHTLLYTAKAVLKGLCGDSWDIFRGFNFFKGSRIKLRFTPFVIYFTNPPWELERKLEVELSGLQQHFNLVDFLQQR